MSEPTELAGRSASDPAKTPGESLQVTNVMLLLVEHQLPVTEEPLFVTEASRSVAALPPPTRRFSSVAGGSAYYLLKRIAAGYGPTGVRVGGDRYEVGPSSADTGRRSAWFRGGPNGGG